MIKRQKNGKSDYKRGGLGAAEKVQQGLVLPPGGSQPPDWRGASGYAVQLGFADEVDFWGMVGLLHDIDFELYPEEHCIKAPELLREGGLACTVWI